MTRHRLLILTSLSLLLANCSMLGLQTDPTYDDKQRAELYKNGSLVSDEGGSDIFGGDKKKTQDSSGLGINGYLWRATLDIVSFMPIASADPFGGVILTDWYTPPETPNERTKLNIYIRDRELRADGIKVSVFRQIKNAKGDWVDAPVAAATASGLENTILTRARQIRMAKKQAQ